ncbi:TolB family protein, partial [Gemmatimonadota bacterium]
QMDHSGSGLTKLVDAVGIVQQPDINTAGDIALIDDTRWDFARDELAIYSGGTLRYASGSSVDTTFNGFRPSWSPDGTRIALGDNHVSVDGKGARRLSVFIIGGSGTNVIRESVSPPEFTDLGENEHVFSEGGNGVAWDPQNQYIAYVTVVSDTITFESRLLILLWERDSSEVRVLTEGSGPLGWSPTGEFLLFHRIGDNWGEPGLWQIPRDGGTPVNLSAITMQGAVDWQGGFCK